MIAKEMYEAAHQRLNRFQDLVEGWRGLSRNGDAARGGRWSTRRTPLHRVKVDANAGIIL